MSRFRLVSLVVLGILVAAGPAAAQPFSAWLLKGSGHGFVEIPASSAFNFTTGFTLEAWVQGTDSGACSSIAGKNWNEAWWVGICGTSLRSYIKGTDSRITAGTVTSDWTHVAVTYDGANRKHYIDGELVSNTAETGPMGISTAAVRINSDVNYQLSFGNIDELRLWNVARTQDQIRSTITTTIDAPQTGLVAVYHLDGSPNDAIAGRNGTTGGTGAYLTSPVALTCGSTTTTALCISGSRFSVTSKWLLPDGTSGVGTVVPGSNATSGLFWFFGPDNWELLVKVLDGCPLNNRKWVFSAATTNVHYSLVVTDVKSGQTKRYFNYFGQSAPAVTDTGAFATCP